MIAAPVEYENYYKGSGIVKAGNHRAAMKLPPQLPPHNTSPYVTARIGELFNNTVKLV